jgi:hypothetical protein
MATPEACVATLLGTVSSWDRGAILGSHQQPNQPQSGTRSPHLPPQRQSQSRSHSPHDLSCPETSAATPQCEGLAQGRLSQATAPCGPKTKAFVTHLQRYKGRWFRPQCPCQAGGMPSKDRLMRLTPYGPGETGVMTNRDGITDVVTVGGPPSVACRLPSTPLCSSKSPPRYATSRSSIAASCRRSPSISSPANRSKTSLVQEFRSL